MAGLPNTSPCPGAISLQNQVRSIMCGRPPYHFRRSRPGKPFSTLEVSRRVKACSFTVQPVASAVCRATSRWRGARVIATLSARISTSCVALGRKRSLITTRNGLKTMSAMPIWSLTSSEATRFERSWDVLRRGGVLVTTVAPISQEKATARGVKGIFFIVKPSRSELIEIARLIDGGHVRPSIEAVFPLERAREAFERGLSRHVRGKFVLQVFGSSVRMGPRAVFGDEFGANE